VVDRDLSGAKGAEIVNRSRLMLLVASLESLVHYLHVLLLVVMVDDSMLRELELGLIVEGLRLTVMKGRRARVKLIVKSLFTIAIWSHVVQFAVECRGLNIRRILDIDPRVLFLIHHFTLLHQPAVVSDLVLKVRLISRLSDAFHPFRVLMLLGLSDASSFLMDTGVRNHTMIALQATLHAINV
jgi:hypothetical protein